MPDWLISSGTQGSQPCKIWSGCSSVGAIYDHWMGPFDLIQVLI